RLCRTGGHRSAWDRIGRRDCPTATQTMIAKISGPGHEISEYAISDREMPVGSTLGAPKAALIIKATGALEKIFSCEAGTDVFRSLVVHHWDRNSGIPLLPSPGEFMVHPDR